MHKRIFAPCALRNWLNADTYACTAGSLHPCTLAFSYLPRMIYLPGIGVLRLLESGFTTFRFGKGRVHDALSEPPT